MRQGQEASPGSSILRFWFQHLEAFNSRMLENGPMGQQLQHLGTCKKCSISGLILDLPNLDLLFKRFPISVHATVWEALDRPPKEHLISDQFPLGEEVTLPKEIWGVAQRRKTHDSRRAIKGIPRVPGFQLRMLSISLPPPIHPQDMWTDRQSCWQQDRVFHSRPDFSELMTSGRSERGLCCNIIDLLKPINVKKKDFSPSYTTLWTKMEC